MSDTLTKSTQPGDQFTLTGRAIQVRPDAMFYKHPASQFKVQVEIDGETRWADVRILDAGEDASRWFNGAEDVLAKLDAPAESESEPQPAVAPADLDGLTVRQLREAGANLGIELPKSANRAELVATLKTAIAETEAAA